MDGDKQLRLYADLMEEVKLRIDCIDGAVRGRTGYPNRIVREFCYLQLRLLCELIALACIVAHGDITFSHGKRLKKFHSADDIFKELEKLRPHFFPVAFRQNQLPTGDWEMQHILPQPLSKAEILALYGRTHEHLHRGDLKRLISKEESLNLVIDVPEIISWAQKINDQLAVHIIALDETDLVCCILRTTENQGKVQVSTLRKGEPLKPPS